MKKAFITPKEYAEYRGVHPSTVIRWIKEGLLPAEQPAGKKGHYAIPVEMMVSNALRSPIQGWPEKTV